MNSLWRLTWLEIKIFAREPLGLFGTLAVPVLVFVVIARLLGRRVTSPSPKIPRFLACRPADLRVVADCSQRGFVAGHHRGDLSRRWNPEAAARHAAASADDPDGACAGQTALLQSLRCY